MQLHCSQHQVCVRSQAGPYLGPVYKLSDLDMVHSYSSALRCQPDCLQSYRTQATLLPQMGTLC
jgi:hypothetical protein